MGAAGRRLAGTSGREGGGWQHLSREARTPTAAERAAAKEDEANKKAIKDYMSTALSSERTFFRWMWCAINLGGLGTLALTFFTDRGFPFRLIVTGTAWILALGAALYGLLQFHRRRRALLTNTLDPEKWESPGAPGAVIAVFFVVVMSLVVYAVASGKGLEVKVPVIEGGGHNV